jgi:hypothetical protein
MATSSILGGERALTKPSGHDVDALGPSDSSDSGSDIQGERAMSTLPDNPSELGSLTSDGRSDTDSSGTGERASATGSDPREGADILPDRVASEDSLEDSLASEDWTSEELSEVNGIVSDEEDSDPDSDSESDTAGAQPRQGSRTVGLRKRQSGSKDRPR